jgi:hypothetical protein
VTEGGRDSRPLRATGSDGATARPLDCETVGPAGAWRRLSEPVTMWR